MRILLPTLAALGALGASLAPTLPASPTSQTTILPEVVVEPKKRQVLHITGYMREYSTLTTYGDTLLLFREKTVDFMVPTRRAKGYEGWLRPRVLASRSYYHFTDAAGLDSVSDRYQRHISWSGWLEIFDRVPLPDALRHTVSATDTLRGRYSPAVTWARDDDDVSIAVDVLAAPAASPWTPALHSIFKDRVEFYRFKVNYYLTGVDDYEAQADNIALVTRPSSSTPTPSSTSPAPNISPSARPRGSRRRRPPPRMSESTPRTPPPTSSPRFWPSCCVSTISTGRPTASPTRPTHAMPERRFPRRSRRDPTS